MNTPSGVLLYKGRSRFVSEVFSPVFSSRFQSLHLNLGRIDADLRYS